MLTIEGLAERWSVTMLQAKDIVVRGGVPRIELRPRTGRYISWRTTRFRLEDVIAWEESRTTTAGVTPPPPVVAVKIKPTGPRPAIPNHLGRWKD